MAITKEATSLLVVFLAAVVAETTAAAASSPFRTVYAFGDSFTDTGNTHSTTGPYSFGYVSSPPYGATFFHRSTNRYSDGRLVVDFLAQRLNLPSFLPPYLISSSSTSNNGSASSSDIGVNFASIMTQLGWFDAHIRRTAAAGKKNKVVADALFWVGEIGANDYAYSVIAPPSIRPKLIRTMAGLLDRGAKYMIVQGLPLTGCLPLSMSLARAEDRDNVSCVASVNGQSYAHNRRLLSNLRRLRQKNPDAVIAYADYYAAHLAVMRNPSKYGFTEPFKTCCGSGGGAYNFDLFATCGSPEVTTACAQPEKYVNWDGVHMTEAMYKVVSAMFFQDGDAYCRPSFSAVLARKAQAKI
ncbi:hypothetical protein PR202_ga14137 [Eleusine coracana subsp. coracana]|uniref:GDSL esterase/lipase n=1 Tax=Eleusine coracana subsp. coracana TaxID=191504 RepID=A0AAV5CGM9_ELECO|nr:hypothetical protein PR202_ga14137 [Eleusine coracana subsp. coracana]